LSANRDDWVKVAKVWYRVVDFIKDPKHYDEAIEIMSSRVGLSPDEYKTFVDGTKILTLEEAKKHFQKGSGFSSIYGSTKLSDDFNVANKVYDTPQDVDAYIDPSITTGL
jgi:NitT/TauT family transport system substrate-binding protein